MVAAATALGNAYLARTQKINQWYLTNGKEPGNKMSCIAIDCLGASCPDGTYPSECGGGLKGKCQPCTNGDNKRDKYYASQGIADQPMSCGLRDCARRAEQSCVPKGQVLVGCGYGKAGDCMNCSAWVEMNAVCNTDGGSFSRNCGTSFYKTKNME